MYVFPTYQIAQTSIGETLPSPEAWRSQLEAQIWSDAIAWTLLAAGVLMVAALLRSVMGGS